MQNMLKSVRDYLSGFGKVDDRVIEAMSKVNRKNFMPEGLKEKAYLDAAMPIGYGQTISQPSTVARMLSLLELKEGDRVLEIGTGSGWNAVLISCLIGKGKVISLEKYDELIEQAGERIKELKIENIKIAKKDFRNLKDRFDKIIFTAGISSGQEQSAKPPSCRIIFRMARLLFVLTA